MLAFFPPVRWMAMPSSYLQIKQPRWRYIASGIAFVITAIILFTAYHNSDSALRPAITSAKVSGDVGLVDDVYNTTLGFEKILAVSLPERTDHRDGLILASAVSNIDIEFVDGVHGDKVLEKTLPPQTNNDLANSTIGSWRAHLNAIADIVHNNYTSALILEDDVDWDIRLKSLLKDFAVSAHTLAHSSPSASIAFRDLPHTSPPLISPYGDDWDLIWLGHCGMALPSEGSMVMHYEDASVPEPHNLHSWRMEDPTPLGIYPNHTRVFMRDVSEPVCSLAYAVSQAGARKILYRLGLKTLDGPFDLMLGAWCGGLALNKDKQVCLGVLPQLFDHHRRRGPKSRESDIEDHGAEYREKAETLNIRWSVRMDMERILRGETEYEDQWPDTD